MSDSPARLPKEPIDRFTKAFGRFLRIEAGAGVVLLLCAIVALAASNSPWSGGFVAFWETPVGISAGEFDYVRSLKHWINDGLMTLFFFVVALELKREFDGMIAAAVVAGFVIGKPLGVLACSYLAVRLGLAMKPPSLSWPVLAAGGLLTGIGFTMALFIAELAFDPIALVSAKLGIMTASIVAGACGLAALFFLTRERAPLRPS